MLFCAMGGASALRVGPIRLSASQPGAAPASTKALYAQIDTVLRRGQQEGGASRAVTTARALGKRWMEMPPAELVEVTLVSGSVLLESYEEGLAILLEAEEGANLNVSGKCYSALMRLAQSSGRSEDVLRLLARTRAYGVETTDGQLLGAMRAAASLSDWGAVARLHAELTEGRDAAAESALELETYAADPSVLGELASAAAELAASSGTSGTSGTSGEASRIRSALPPTPTPREYTLALSLALRAHCERGDLARVAPLVERMRAQGARLTPEEYALLLSLARRLRTPAPLLALKPIDFQRSLTAEVEPRVFAVTNRLGLIAAGLGSVERGVVAAAAVAALLGAAALLSGALEASDAAAVQDAAWALAATDTASTASASTSTATALEPVAAMAAAMPPKDPFGADVAALLY